ncbi:MAG TPA: ASPIC/UnbV domain-containing protein, partial [Bryobacteraceae bacterium]|nr:ASPIC/UnbV domain-containing protein [Bryobacteraceae bacterium]
GQEPELLRNDGGNSNHWLEVRLVGVRSNRDGIGARVKLTAGGFTQVDELVGGASYQASHDPRLHFGLGAAAKVDTLEVRWPSGRIDRLSNVSADRVLVLKEGGVELPSPYRPIRR